MEISNKNTGIKSLGTYKFNQFRNSFNFHVANGIFGMDFIEKFKAKLNFGNLTFKINKKNLYWKFR